MAKINPHFPWDVYQFIIKPLREADEFGILERYVGAAQQGFETIQSNILSLDDLRDSDAVPDQYIQYIYPLLGWTSELSDIVDNLSEDDQRRLLLIGASIWKSKGSTKGITDMIRAFTGRDAISYNWFDIQAAVDSIAIDVEGRAGNDPYIVGGKGIITNFNPTFNYNDDRDVSYVYFSDEAENVNAQLLHDILYLNKPVSEIMYLLAPNIVEDFHLGVSKLTSYDTSKQAVWNETELKADVPAGGDSQLNLDTTNWKQYTFSIVAEYVSVGNYFELVTHATTDSNGNLLEGFSTRFFSSGNIVIYKTLNSITTTIATYSPQNTNAGIGGVAPDNALQERFTISVKISVPAVSDVRIVVSKDGGIKINHIEQHVCPSGTELRIRNNLAGKIDNIIAYRHFHQTSISSNIPIYGVADRLDTGMNIPLNTNPTAFSSTTTTPATQSDGSVIQLVAPMTDNYRSSSITSGIDVLDVYGTPILQTSPRKAIVDFNPSNWVNKSENVFSPSSPTYSSLWHVSRHRSLTGNQSIAYTTGESDYRPYSTSGWQNTELQGEAEQIVNISTAYRNFIDDYKLIISLKYLYLYQNSLPPPSSTTSQTWTLRILFKTSGSVWYQASTRVITSGTAADRWQTLVHDLSEVGILASDSLYGHNRLSDDILADGIVTIRLHFAATAASISNTDNGMYVDNIKLLLGEK